MNKWSEDTSKKIDLLINDFSFYGDRNSINYMKGVKFSRKFAENIDHDVFGEDYSLFSKSKYSNTLFVNNIYLPKILQSEIVRNTFIILNIIGGWLVENYGITGFDLEFNYNKNNLGDLLLDSTSNHSITIPENKKNMENKIQAEFKSAMLQKDVVKKRALEALKTAITNKKSEKGRPNSEDISDDEILTIIQKQIKQRKESVEIYKSQNRSDLYEPELYEITVLESFLPQQMDESEVRAILGKIISDSGATSIKEMGKIMGLAKKEFAGKADNTLISTIIKELLN